METLLPEGRARKLAGLTPDEKRFFQAIVRDFPERGGPPSPDDLAALAASYGLDAGVVLADLVERDLLQIDARTGAITCAYPFSGRPTRHRVEIDGERPVYAMCALDALGIPFMLGRDARITSQDPITSEPVVVEVRMREGSATWNPPAAVINVGRLDGDGPLLHTCCGITHIFTSSDSAMNYLAARPGLKGLVLGQREAVEAARDMFGGLLHEDQEGR